MPARASISTPPSVSPPASRRWPVPPPGRRCSPASGPSPPSSASAGYREPVLVASADGVGTKLNIAAALGRYDTVGVDLVNHCVNDILTTGAEPLFFLDYLAGSDLSGGAEAGGRAAAWPPPAATPAAPSSAARRPTCPTSTPPATSTSPASSSASSSATASSTAPRIEEGDVLLGLPSSGLHTNGYSLVRSVFDVGRGGDPEAEKAALYRTYPELGLTLGEALLVPHRCYYREVKPVLRFVKGIAHITGGGLIDNVPRVLPEGLAARFDRASLARAAHLYADPARG